MTANELTKAVKDLFTKAGYNVWRSNSGSRQKNVKLCPPGTPDLIGYSPEGAFIGLEIKVGRDQIRETQVAWHERINSTRFGRAYVIRSVEEAEGILYDRETMF